MLLETVKRLRNRSAADNKTAIEVAVQIVEGVKATDAQIDKARIAAGMSTEEFATLLEVLAARKQVADAYDPDALAARQKELLAAQMTAHEELTEGERRLEELQLRVRELHENNRRALSIRSRHAADARTLRNETAEALRSTGDSTDWRLVRWPLPPVQATEEVPPRQIPVIVDGKLTGYETVE